MSKCGFATLLIPPRGADDAVVGLGVIMTRWPPSPLRALTI